MEKLFKRIIHTCAEGIPYDEAVQFLLWVYCTLDVLPSEFRGTTLSRQDLCVLFSRLAAVGKTAIESRAFAASDPNRCLEVYMRGVTITNQNETQTSAIDLRDIFRVLDAEVRSSHWRLRNIEALGSSADQLHNIADQGETVEGEKLVALAAGIDQTLDGMAEGYHAGNESPWIRIRAVDGTGFDVESDSVAVLDKLKEAFRNAADLPS